MHPLLLAVVVLVLLLVALVLGLGRGSWRRGALRLVRRERTARRRVVAPTLDRLRRVVARAWSRPTYRGLATQLRSIADRVERVALASTEFVRAQRDLTRSLDYLKEISAASMPQSTVQSARRNEPGMGRGWFVALLLALTGLGFAVGNVWLLTEFVIENLPATVRVPETMTIPVGASSLAFLLGLAYFALSSLGGVASRVFRGLASLVIAMLVVAEGVAIVVALESAGLVTLTWWGGIGVATLLGAAGGLVPAVIAALAHAAIERLESWLTARDTRAARRALTRQRETSNQLGTTLDELESRVTTLRAELKAMTSEALGPLLLEGEEASVERTTLVLRRVSRSMEAERRGDPVGTSGATLRLLRDVITLGFWAVVTVATLFVVLPAAAELWVGVTWLSAAAVAGVGVLLLSGAILRWILSRPVMTRTDPLRGVLVLLAGLAAVALGTAFGPAVARAGVLDASPLQAGAFVVLLVLVGALASARLAEGVSALASLAIALFVGTAWLIVALADLLLVGLDLLLTGARSTGRSVGARRGPDLGSGRQTG